MGLRNGTIMTNRMLTRYLLKEPPHKILISYKRKRNIQWRDHITP